MHRYIGSTKAQWVQTITRTHPCATCIWSLHPAPTRAQDSLDPPQLVLEVFFLSSSSTNNLLALMVVITCNLQQPLYILFSFCARRMVSCYRYKVCLLSLLCDCSTKWPFNQALAPCPRELSINGLIGFMWVPPTHPHIWASLYVLCNTIEH